jgi:hypothetical protein
MGNTGPPWFATSAEEAAKAQAYRDGQTQIEAHIERIEDSLQGDPAVYMGFADNWAPMAGDRTWDPSNRMPADDDDQPK